ncbi:30S ribosomal protein S15 [archaeon]|nr:30S ribosomal protein S15 [archaeon]
MARMHSRARGRSGSKKPLTDKKPSWVRYKPKEVEMLAVKLAKEEHSPSAIGLILRDSYGVPSVKSLLGKSVTQLLKEKKLEAELPEDLQSLMKKAAMIRKHMSKNKHDMTALRGIQLSDAKILRLTKYYKRVKRLPEDWEYKPEDSKMLAE